MRFKWHYDVLQRPSSLKTPPKPVPPQEAISQLLCMLPHTLLRGHHSNILKWKICRFSVPCNQTLRWGKKLPCNRNSLAYPGLSNLVKPQPPHFACFAIEMTAALPLGTDLAFAPTPASHLPLLHKNQKPRHIRPYPTKNEQPFQGKHNITRVTFDPTSFQVS